MLNHQADVRSVLEMELKKVGNVDNSRYWGRSNNIDEVEAEYWEAADGDAGLVNDVVFNELQADSDHYADLTDKTYLKNKQEKDRLEALIKMTHTTDPKAWKHFVSIGTFSGVSKRNNQKWHKDHGHHGRFI